ncbi:MAG: DEAD/DEAH box helicase [Desulfamplus sp.]|nr:DEAD/DEAH box helicase [Desulfamplus sp.]
MTLPKNRDCLMGLPNTFRAFYGSFHALHPAQIQAIDPILEGRDVILQAATGSGKSEAVLAPSIEGVIQSGRAFSILYIIPTRALAVDLGRRFHSIITERLGLNLAIRTGDMKSTCRERPDMMFTTPESLDVMMGSTNEAINAFLMAVRCIIMDEVHPLIHTYRGVHLKHLLTRLGRRAGHTIQRIAMSATIASPRDVMDALDFRPMPLTCHIESSVTREVDARIIHLKDEPAEFPALLTDLHDTWNYRKILLFANSRGDCDRLFNIARRIDRFKGAALLHYSNLKPGERKSAEKSFRKGSRALCIATSTLELGIDVGDVDAVLLYGPPDCVSAFLQRIGRSNRRSSRLNFWGLCHGESAPRQVVRFLALLKLARMGRVDIPPRRNLVSVMVQQIISCLYEKGQISPNAILDLFPPEKSGLSQGALKEIFSFLERRRWIKKSLVPGLYSGGFQYGKNLVEYRIWGNFPESRDEYLLELTDISKTVADLPRSIVNQLKAGDRVSLAGRRMKILHIDHDTEKKVVAVSTTARPDKDIFWIGTGAHVSFDVAHMMGSILDNPPMDDPALFSRARELLKGGLHHGGDRVVLANGIVVVPGSRAAFFYRTFLGSAGNLILEWSIKKRMERENILVSSNEIGVECSCPVRFEELKLPGTKRAFHRWVAVNIKILVNLIPLNFFCGLLPADLMALEVAEFLYDSRVIERFSHYMDGKSHVVEGAFPRFSNFGNPEPRFTNFGNPEPRFNNFGNPEDGLVPGEHDPIATDIHGTVKENGRGMDGEYLQGDTLVGKARQRYPCTRQGLDRKPSQGDASGGDTLDGEEPGEIRAAPGLEHDPGLKFRLPWEPEPHGTKNSALHHGSICCLDGNPHGTITATMIGSYIRHDQCPLGLCLAYLGRNLPDAPKPHPAGQEKAVRRAALEQGIIHGKNVLNELEKKGKRIIHMPLDVPRGERFHLFLNRLKNLTEQGELPLFFSKPLLEQEIGEISMEGREKIFRGMAMPDLIVAFMDPEPSGKPGSSHGIKPGSSHGIEPESSHGIKPGSSHGIKTGIGHGIVLEVGDIRNSRKPLYHHKWQVAFYAVLLQKIMDNHGIGARVSSRGFLITRPKNPMDNAVYENHTFDLTPFTTALPVLMENIYGILSSLSDGECKPDYRLQTHCTLCHWFSLCYGNAIANNDIQFLPEVTAGTLMKLKKMGINTVKELHNICQGFDNHKDGLPLHAMTHPLRQNKKFDNNKDGLPPFSPGDVKKLHGQCKALVNGKIYLHKRQTHLFPANLSKAIFLHTLRDPIAGLPAGIGFVTMDMTRDGNLKELEREICIFDNSVEKTDALARWRRFLSLLTETWNKGIKGPGRGPHLFHFGPESRDTILEWAGIAVEAQESMDPAFMREKQPSAWSDLKSIVMEHFYLPAPGTPSLYSLAHIFECNMGLCPPESLFHESSGQEMDIWKGPSRKDSHGGERDDGEMPVGKSVGKNAGKSAGKSEVQVMEAYLGTMAELFKGVHPHLESLWLHNWDRGRGFVPFIREEMRLKEMDMATIQCLPLAERMDRFRSLAYLKFKGRKMDGEGKVIHIFSTTGDTMPSKFRGGDFLKLLPHGMAGIQDGWPVILADHNMETGDVALKSRGGPINPDESIFYSLEEDATDFTGEKLIHAAEYLANQSTFHPANALMAGKRQMPRDPQSGAWLERMLEKGNPGLNPSQTEALKLPFHHRTSLIHGPPGTGKTHLLGWIVVTLVMEAFHRGVPLKIGVTALTHQAIDTVLEKVVSLVGGSMGNLFPGQVFPGSCIKWGKGKNSSTPAHAGPGRHAPGSDSDNPGEDNHNPPAYSHHPGQGRLSQEQGRPNAGNSTFALEYLDDQDDVFSRTWAIIGATGFGFYNLFNSRSGEFHRELDWIIFDEASQVVMPQALLSLVYGKGNYLFLGDVHQLPPIVMGSYQGIERSILSILSDKYPQSHQKTLDITYRMNREICAFPSKMWYQGRLRPHSEVENSRRAFFRTSNGDGNSAGGGLHSNNEPGNSAGGFFRIHNGADISAGYDWDKKPLELILMDHQGFGQECEPEARLMAGIAHDLMVTNGLEPHQIALISPHRAQNNAITKILGEMMGQSRYRSTELPLVDTVERVQGAERDVIIFGLTSSDPDHIHTGFLNSPQRLNVAMTRARLKLIIVGSRAFFSAIPKNDEMLERHHCFKALVSHCKEKQCLLGLQHNKNAVSLVNTA